MNCKNLIKTSKVSMEKAVAIIMIMATVVATFFAVVNSNKVLAHGTDHTDAPTVSIQKTVMNVTKNTVFSEQVDADFGDTVKFSLEIRNTGEVALTDLKVIDTLPQNLSFIPGSLELTGGHVFNGDLANGLFVSDLENPNQSMTIIFEAAVADESQFGDGETILINEAIAAEEGSTPSPSVSDTAKIRIFKTASNVNTPPVITLVGNNPMEIDVNSSFVDPGATATDTEDGDLTSQIVKTGSVDNTTVGSYTLTYVVKDSGDLYATTTRTVVVKPVGGGGGICISPVVHEDVIKTVNGTVGQSLNYSLSDSVYGGSQPMTFTLAGSSSLPEGITLNNGTLSGVPENATSTVIKFFVENACGREDFKVKLDIIQGPTQCVAPEVDHTIDIVNGVVGHSFSYDLSQNVTSGSRPITFTLVHSSLPGGLSINSDMLTGTPTVAATSTFKFFVENACGREDFKVKLIIAENDGSNTPPEITLIGANPFEITVNTAFIDPGATATDIEDGDLTSVITTSGTVNASTTGTYVINYSVTDSGGLSASTSRQVIVRPADSNPPSNPPTTINDNGGGGGGGGRRRDISNLITGEILGATSCSYLRDYLKIGWQNDPIEVLKMQSFLNVFEKENLSLNGVFDQATFDATERFQNKYFDDILKPWGHTAPTGFVYILTKKKVNEIYCNTLINLSATDQQEISSFRSYLQSLGSDGVKSIDVSGSVGVNKANTPSNVLEDVLNNSTTSTAITDIGIKDNLDGSVVKNAAISLLALPQKLFNLNQCRNISLLALLMFLIIILLIITLLLRSKKPNRLTGISETKNNVAESPVIVLPSTTENKNNTSFEPGEEIIIENPEETPDEIIDEKIS